MMVLAITVKFMVAFLVGFSDISYDIDGLFAVVAHTHVLWEALITGRHIDVIIIVKYCCPGALKVTPEVRIKSKDKIKVLSTDSRLDD